MSSTRSDPGSAAAITHMKKFSNADANDDTFMIASPPPDPHAFNFKNCNVFGCSNTSAFAVWDCMTLRCGFDTCTAHTSTEAIRVRVENTKTPTNLVTIFYDIEVTLTGEIEQISAVSTDGTHFDTYIRTSVRRHNSPILGQIPAMLYTLTAVEPKTAMDHLIHWVRRVRTQAYPHASSDENVIMVAHGGSKHDHVLVLKWMMKWGINPPRWRFADTLPLFKIVVCPSEKASLTELVNRYAAWFDHTPHDALSDAKGLVNVVMMSVRDPITMLYVFSSDYETFVRSVGLNVFRIRSMVPFPLPKAS